MRRPTIAAFLFLAALDLVCSARDPGKEGLPNTLTAAELRDGWRLLFDGKTMNGWRGAYLEMLPARGWEVRDGVLCVNESGGGEAAFGGDIVTIEEFSDFDLKLDFMLTPGANSGIKYFVIEALPKTPGSAKGLEYQLLDDVGHPDAKLGIAGNRTCASLYDLIPAANKPPVPIGEWNQARIVVKGRHVEHWLNGVKVLEFERGGKEFLAHKAESKFKDIPDFGEYPKGHILLQDHGNRVCFRNIKIRVL
jgi:3-keto-disaccharide hydrolase